MSLVGPRPALFTQKDLINLRDKYEINSLKPGITGLAPKLMEEIILVLKKSFIRS